VKKQLNGKADSSDSPKHLQNNKVYLFRPLARFYVTDFSEAPELTDEQLAQMKPSHLRNMANYKPIKKTVNVRLDADILEWLQSAGRDYQTRMNAIPG